MPGATHGYLRERCQHDSRHALTGSYLPSIYQTARSIEPCHQSPVISVVKDYGFAGYFTRAKVRATAHGLLG
jgi:hypothetical protein